MANTWNVSSTNPNSGTVENHNDGTFVFPENNGTTDIEYTVTYTSDSCNCECKKTVVIKGKECNCTISGGYTIDVPGASLGVLVGNITGCTSTSFGYVSGTDFANNWSINENNEITASIEENTGASKRYAAYSAACDSTNLLEIWQVGTATPVINWSGYSGYSNTCKMCDCNAGDFKLTGDTINVGAEGITGETIGTIKDCVDLYVSPEEWRGEFEWANDELKITLPANEGAAISEEITFTYEDYCGNSLGTSSFTVNQAAGCNCDKITVTTPIFVSYAGGTYTAGTLLSDCVQNIGIDRAGDTSGIIASTALTGNEVIITCNANSTPENKRSTCQITGKSGSETCSKDFTLRQSQPPITINLTVWASGKYTDTTTLLFDDGQSQTLTYPSTSGGYSGTISLDSYISGTITGASVADSVVSHMGWPAHLVSGSDTSLFDGAHIKVEV